MKPEDTPLTLDSLRAAIEEFSKQAPDRPIQLLVPENAVHGLTPILIIACLCEICEGARKMLIPLIVKS